MAGWSAKPYREVEKDLARVGFEPVRQKGSHVVFRNGEGRSLTVPDHGGSDIAKGTMRSIARQAGVDPDDLFGDRPRRGGREREPMDLLQEGNPPPTARMARSGRGQQKHHHTGREERGRNRGD